MSWYIWYAPNYLSVQNTILHWIQEIRRRLSLRTKVRETGFRSKFTGRQPKRHRVPSIHSHIIDAQKSNFLKVTVISFAYLSVGSLLVLFCVPLNGSIFLALFDKWFGTAKDNCEKKNLIWDRQSARTNVGAYGHRQPLKLRFPSAFPKRRVL